MLYKHKQERRRACRSNGETTFEQDIIKKSRCEVHVFDPTLGEEVAAQVRAIKGVTFHPYGLGAFDGEVSYQALMHIMRCDVYMHQHWLPVPIACFPKRNRYLRCMQCALPFCAAKQLLPYTLTSGASGVLVLHNVAESVSVLPLRCHLTDTHCLIF